MLKLKKSTKFLVNVLHIVFFPAGVPRFYLFPMAGFKTNILLCLKSLRALNVPGITIKGGQKPGFFVDLSFPFPKIFRRNREYERKSCVLNGWKYGKRGKKLTEVSWI